MALVDPYITLNVPKICQSGRGLARIFQGEALAALDARGQNDVQDYKLFTVNGKKVYISQKFADSGLDQAWLETPLGEGIACYVPVYGGLSWLPLTRPLQWKTQPAAEAAPVDGAGNASRQADPAFYWGFSYARVEYGEETCFADLCCNAWKYFFDIRRGVFVLHPRPEWNAIKGLLRRYFIPLTGGTDERVADYGRLILFLLSKVQLSGEERAAFAGLLDKAPSLEALGGVIRREEFIQKFVSEAKANPEAFLTWGEDWTHYWWDTKPTEENA